MRNPTAQRRSRALRNQATDAERTLWRFLRLRQLGGHRFRRQVPIDSYIADFACLEAKLVIELDGGQHQQRQNHYQVRDRQIEAQGFRVLRFWNDQVFRELDAVLEEVMRALEMSCPHPDPPPQAGEGTGKTDRPPHVGQGTGETVYPLQAGEGTRENHLSRSRERTGGTELVPPNGERH